MKKFSLLTSLFTGLALFTSIAKADLVLSDVHIVSDWNNGPVFVENGDEYQITSKLTTVDFYVRLGVLGRGSSIDPISGSKILCPPDSPVPVLNFLAKSKTTGAVVSKKAVYSGEYGVDDETGLTFLIFTYTPEPTDYIQGLSMQTGGKAPITLGTTGSIYTDEATDGVLPASSTLQTIGSSLMSDFNVNSAGVEINMFKIATDDTSVSLAVGSDFPVFVRRADEGNTAAMTLRFRSEDTSIVSVSPQSVSIEEGSSAPVSVNLTGVRVGTTTLSVTVNGKTAESLLIPVTVTKSGDASLLTFAPMPVIMGEGSSQQVQVTLGSPASADTTFTVTGGNAAELTVPSQFIVSTGSSVGFINMQALDGTALGTTYNLTVTDASGEYISGSFPVTITNVPPTLVYPSTDSANPSTLNAVVNESVTINASAIDPAGDYDNLTYTWALPDGSTRTGKSISVSFGEPGGQTLVVTVDDGDGAAVVGYVAIEVEDAVTVVFTDEFPDRGKLPGWAECTFTILSPVGKVWNEEGNSFRPGSAIRVQANLTPGSYPLCWKRDSTDFVVGNNVLATPNGNTTISLNAPAEGVQTIYYIASLPFYPHETFGDIDQDGLSDGWESLYFATEGVEATSDNLLSLPLAISRGDYAGTGNPDGDRLPTDSTEVIDNVLIDGAKVEVFRYPLDFSSGRQTYAVGEGKPSFTNLREYRGLRELRDEAVGWTFYNSEFARYNEADRGNNPGTDPTLDDTDEDGYADGWEYYFWSTILYEVNSKNWRAYDPSFVLYDEEEPAESGIPLFNHATDEVFSETFTGTVANGVTTITGTLKEETLPMNINSFEGLIGLEADVAGGAGTVVKVPTTVRTATGGFYLACEYNGDLYSIGEINPATGEFVVSISDNLAFLGNLGDTIQISYKTVKGLYSKEWLLDRFDPMKSTVSAPDTVPFEELGLDPTLWDISSDIDNDGLTLEEEYLLGTDPLHWDTDRDGMPDGWEVMRGLEPLDPRSRINGCGPEDNPDGDYMAESEGYIHADAYIYDWKNYTYWNGSVSLPFNPTFGVTGGKPFSNLQEFLFARYLLLNNSLADKDEGLVNTATWQDYTTNPLDNDTNQDGLPDGWQAYVGYSPITGLYEEFDIYLRKYGLPPATPGDEDEDKLSLMQEFDNATTVAPPGTTPVDWNGRQIYAQIVTVGNGTSTNGASQAVIRYFPWDSTNRLFAAWTNKLLPTDPYNFDTDGDGLGDMQEYEDLADFNADGDKLANFNPCSADTNRNYLPDMFEYLGGIYNPTNWPTGVSQDDPYGPFGDPDGDGLPNYQEYLTGAVYGWRYDHFYRMDNEALFMPNSAIVDPDDPSNSYPYGASIVFRHYQPVDFVFPLVNPVVYRTRIDLLRKVEKDNGFDETVSPAIANDNGEDNPLPQEIIQRLYEVMENPEHALFLEIEVQQELLALKENAERYYFSYGRVPATWDSSYWVIPNELPYYYMHGNFSGIGGFPSTMPRNIDTDNDGMEDYWEVFHGLNPLYGGTSFSVVGGSLVDSDRADNHPFGDGTTDNWIMNSDPRVNRVQQMTPFGLYPVSREPTHFVHPFVGYIAESAHFDANLRPWLTGDPYADPDHDGLSNHEESFNHLASDVLLHTDPSPYWLTDTSNPYSHVNLYYTTKGYEDYWIWGFDPIPPLAVPPAYLFSFEQNEGFDTDNDNRNDVEESTSLDGNGKTDPLDVESPYSRKALYLNGNAAARTRNPYFHDRFAMTSFTVEFWVRSAQPGNGKTQTILHRPVFMPIDDMAGASYWGIRNTFLVQLDPEGHVTAQVDNDATETVSSAIVVSAGRVVSNVWNHVAVTMDAANDRLTLYLNGEVSDSVKTSLKPCTGVIYGAHYITSTQNTTNLVSEIQIKDSTTNISTYSFSPAPIVIGGYDRNPWGVVSGEYNMDPWGPGTILGNSQPEFDDDRFFVGWVDEVRIWDQVRSQSEILNAMQKRFTKSDIQAINQAKFAWKQNSYVTATSVTQFPQELLYHYSFDSLPDVVADPSRDTTIIPDYDILARPNGWASIDTKNPIREIPWWASARDRSNVYGPVYDYVPVIENTVAHMPQHPPLDIGSLRANYNSNTWDVVSYRARSTEDWVLDVFDNLAIYVDSATDILLSQVRNTMNPYGMTYYTSNELGFSYDGRMYSGLLDLYSPYRNSPVLSDMLPLRDAVGDIDVELWDGKGAGFENSSLDSDGDGLPDWWEIAHGLDPNDPTGVNGAYGDFDGDGLDNYSEYRAGTSPNSADSDSDGYSDYFSRKDGQSLTYGELYDDADGMPNDWEVEYGLDPNRYDATEDLDSDGWTNLEEFYAGTMPNDARSYPTPKMRVTYLYNGINKSSASLQLLTYAEKTAGKKMGGQYDARYFATPTPASSGVAHTGITGESGSGVVYHGRSYDVSYIPYSHIGNASLRFSDGIPALNTEWVNTAVAPYDDEIGVFFERTDETGSLSGVYLHYETGAILTYGNYFKNRPYVITDLEIGEYVYPVTFNNLYKSTDGTRGHVVSGPNRFIGFLDLNGDNAWNEGEPMGLNTALPTLVGWDTVDVTIPLTDTLFGYPRVSWPASTNANNSSYTVEFKVPMAGSQTFKVEEPRTFFHEGDFRNAGKYGLSLGSATDMTVSYSVYDSFNVLVTNGSFRLDAGADNRRKMTAKYPLDYTIIYNSSIELQWEMDWRNQGVVVTIKNDDTGETYISKQKYAFPVRNGLTTDTNYSYTLKPQELEGGAYVSLPAGRYSYTITELINTTGITPQSVSGRFQLVTSDEARALYSISGVLKYFGKTQDLVEKGIVLASEVTGTDCTGSNLPEDLVPGTISFLIKKNGTTIETLNDVNADGVLKPEAATYAYSGVVNYKDRSWSIHFSEAPEAGTTIELATKKFSVPVYIQAFRLQDEASSSVSLSGTPVSQTVTYHKGAFKVEGLTAGAYTVRAFLDSNKNGICDDWESQGFVVTSGSQSPILDSNARPLIITEGNIINTSLILHECDTDNDLLPDAWEYKMFGSITAKSGYDQNTPGVFIWQEYADGALDSDPRTPDTDLDGLTDAMEIMVTHTNTHESDTDADGISDLEEFLSGSDPLDAADAKPYRMPELAFDEDGVPYVDCTYPNLSIGVILNYELQRKQKLDDPVWMPVCDVSVGATEGDITYSADGKTSCELPAGTIRMKPADSSDADFKSGFFRVKITADYGKMVDNGDGTCTYMTWVKKENNTWSFTEAATGKGTLIRDADGNWMFVTDAEGAASGTLIRNEDGSWSFVD